MSTVVDINKCMILFLLNLLLGKNYVGSVYNILKLSAVKQYTVVNELVILH